MNRHSVQRQRIGPAVRRMRRSRGLTLDELADEAEVSPSHLSRLERSQTLPSFPVLAKIADALGVDVNEFVRLEQDVAELDERLSYYAGLLALDDDARSELLDLSIEARRELVSRIEQLAMLTPTSPDVQDQVVRAVESGRDGEPLSAVSTLIERSGLDAISLSRALLFFGLMNGSRKGLIADASLLPILPGQDLVGAYRWAFPNHPIDPTIAQWWRGSREERNHSGADGQGVRLILAQEALRSPLGPVIARSVLGVMENDGSAEIGITERSLGAVSLLTADGGYGLLEQITPRRGQRNPAHMAVWLTGSKRVSPCDAVVDRLWESLMQSERDPGNVRDVLRGAAQEA